MFINNLFIRLTSKNVGEDSCGNKYYTRKHRRYVIYGGLIEPTKVPPMWHAWLHYLTDSIPSAEDLETHNWQQKYSPSLTGTKISYTPERKLVSSEYTSWNPE